MKAAVASLVTALVLVGAAWAGNVTPQQVSKLSARVTTLNGQVAALVKSEAALRGYVDKCGSQFVDVTQYGASDAGSGYVFQNVGADGNNTFNTSALDVTATGDKADYRLVVADPSCTSPGP